MDYPIIELGGVLNSGWSLKQIGLACGGAIFLAAGLGCFLTGGKTHTELVREDKLRRRAALQQMQALGMLPPGMRLDDDDEEDPTLPEQIQIAKPHHQAPTPIQQSEAPRKGDDQAREQRILQVFLERAIQCERLGLYSEAAKHYAEAAALLSYSPSGRAGMNLLILELLISAVNAYVLCGEYVEARATLESFSYDNLTSWTEKLKYITHLTRVLVYLIDARTIDWAQKGLELISDNEGPNSPLAANQHHLLGQYYLKLKNWDQAESELLTAIEIFKKSQKGTNPGIGALGVYDTLVWGYHRQGKVEKSLEILQQVESQCDPKDIGFNEHLLQCALSFGDIDEFDQASSLYERIINQFTDLDKNQFLDKESRAAITELLSNALNNYALLLYNHGHKEKYEQLLERIKQEEKWEIRTNTKCFECRTASVLVVPVDKNNDWIGLFILTFRLKQDSFNFVPGMYLRVVINAIDDEEVLEYEIKPGTAPFIQFQSAPRKTFYKGCYEIKLHLYKDKSMEELLCTHILLYPNEIHTAGVTSYEQLAVKYQL